jgi:hypothetical protein
LQQFGHFYNNYCKDLLSIVILSSFYVLSMVHFLSNRRVKTVNYYSGLEFLWRRDDTFYFDLPGAGTAWARGSRLSSLDLMAAGI